jgi:hypothetical protein
MRALAPLRRSFAFEARREGSPVPRRRLYMSPGVLTPNYLVHRRTSPASLAERGNISKGASPTQALAGLEEHARQVLSAATP